MLEQLVSVPLVAWLSGVFGVLLILHFLWCQYIAYPEAFERRLRKGKPWVYIPLRWKGFHQFQVQLASRLILLGITGTGAAIFIIQSRSKEPILISSFTAVLLIGLARLDLFWTSLRYRQQEDAYFLLHDELRAKLETEGKDYTDAQIRSLATYQHQQRLRKADEAGELLKAMRNFSHSPTSQAAQHQEPVET